MWLVYRCGIGRCGIGKRLGNARAFALRIIKEFSYRTVARATQKYPNTNKFANPASPIRS